MAALKLNERQMELATIIKEQLSILKGLYNGTDLLSDLSSDLDKALNKLGNASYELYMSLSPRPVYSPEVIVNTFNDLKIGPEDIGFHKNYPAGQDLITYLDSQFTDD